MQQYPNDWRAAEKINGRMCLGNLRIGWTGLKVLIKHVPSEFIWKAHNTFAKFDELSPDYQWISYSTTKKIPGGYNIETTDHFVKEPLENFVWKFDNKPYQRLMNVRANVEVGDFCKFVNVRSSMGSFRKISNIDLGKNQVFGQCATGPETDQLTLHATANTMLNIVEIWRVAWPESICVYPGAIK